MVRKKFLLRPVSAYIPSSSFKKIAALEESKVHFGFLKFGDELQGLTEVTKPVFVSNTCLDLY